MAAIKHFDALRDLLLSNPGHIKVLAEGDSWFAYPRRFFALGEASNLIDILGQADDMAVFGRPANGAQLAQMMAPPRRDELLRRLSELPYDALIFSGGGNDIVGEYDFELYLSDRKPGLDGGPPSWDGFEWARFDSKLAQVRALYLELIERVRFYSRNPDTHIVVHTYDVPPPSDQGFELFDAIPIGDSWMMPYMKTAGVPDDERAGIVRDMLNRFERMLVELEASDESGDRFHVVQTQGTIGPDEWRNEIHPTPGGFRRIGAAIDARIRQVVGQPVPIDMDRLKFELAPGHEDR